MKIMKEKRMKKLYLRILALVLATLAFATLLVGCGNGQGGEDTTENNEGSESETVDEIFPDVERKNYNKELYLSIMNDVNPDYVVMGEGKSYSLDTLTKATNLVLNGAKLIGANSDISGPIERGIAPACRALVAPIELATGKQAYFCGKPNPLMMRHGLKKLDCHRANACIIGDRMDTDIIAGIESELDTILVLTGVTSKETIKNFPYRPRFILENVGEIVK